MIRQLKLSAPGRLIAQKMARANLLTAGVTLLVSTVLLILFQFGALRSAMVADLRVQARIVGNNSSAALLFGDRRAGEDLLAALAVSPGVSSAGIFSADGRMLANYQRSNAALPPTPLRPGNGSGRRIGADFVEVYEPVEIDGRRVGSVMIRASMNALYRRLSGYASFTIIASLCSFFLAYLLVRRTRRAVRKAESHLHYLAHVDAVTKLPNRHEFNEKLAFALTRADRQESSVGLLLLDLDNFKLVNDTLGHNAGDTLLRLVADRLKATLRETDIICRIGGDEFVVIVEPSDDLPEVSMVARKILSTLALPYAVDKHQLYVSASIGVSVYPGDAHDAQALTRSADTAMYEAKRQGKSRFEIFRPEMESRAQKRLQIEAKLRLALEQGHFVLHYQPQIDLRTGRLVGMEVLTRWICPDLGGVSPAEFIPVAEESGVIGVLGRWVLQTACRQAAAWRADNLLGQVRTIGVNLSASQTRDVTLVDDIEDILAETGLPHNMLEMEITEGVLMDNVEANLELLQRLRNTGIQLSIDDFGTGYSSMSYLNRFPINKLKIDRSFIKAVPGDGEAIATAIIAMAHSLRLTVVAEGVETPQQAAFLRGAGCDMVQGYYYGAALAPEKMTALLREQRVWAGTGIQALAELEA
jgi:diguanylate cyclase (GGDEF)-like protein